MITKITDSSARWETQTSLGSAATTNLLGTGKRVMRGTCLAFALAVLPVFATAVFSPMAYGQASSSSDAVGKVTDSTGASVPGATVHLINNATGAERTATTNDLGLRIITPSMTACPPMYGCLGNVCSLTRQLLT